MRYFFVDRVGAFDGLLSGDAAAGCVVVLKAGSQRKAASLRIHTQATCGLLKSQIF